MARNIHITRFDGRLYYRVWSTSRDCYVTDATSCLEAIKQTLLNIDLEDARKEFEERFPGEIERAMETGTSSFVYDRQRLHDWDKSMAERVAAGEFDDEENE